MKRFLSLLLAALLLSLCACGGTEVPSSLSPPESPASPSEAPEDVSASGPPESPVLTPAPGVEVRTLLTWTSGTQEVRFPYTPWKNRVLVEVASPGGGNRKLLGFDLESGEQESSFPVSQDNEVCQVLDAAGWEIKIYGPDSYQHCSWTHGLGGYTLPEALREGRRRYRAGFDWDAQPDRNLLTWTDPEGLWLANAEGGDRRLLLATQEMGPYLVEWGMMQDYQPFLADGLPEGERLAYLSPRLINGGRTVAVDFGQWGNQMGHNGLVVLDIATGKTDWYNCYLEMTGDSHEYLDDTHILMGVTLIDVTTGETRRAPRHEFTDRFAAVTGDFTHYFAGDQEDSKPALLTCMADDLENPETVLTMEGALSLYPSVAVGANHVVCRYQWDPGRNQLEEGLLLVTLPE